MTGITVVLSPVTCHDCKAPVAIGRATKRRSLFGPERYPLARFNLDGTWHNCPKRKGRPVQMAMA